MDLYIKIAAILYLVGCSLTVFIMPFRFGQARSHDTYVPQLWLSEVISTMLMLPVVLRALGII